MQGQGRLKDVLVLKQPQLHCALLFDETPEDEILCFCGITVAETSARTNRTPTA